MKPRIPNYLTIALAATLASLGTPTIFAQTATWNAAAGGGWNTASNWLSGNLPAANDNLVFDGSTWTSGTITNTFTAGALTTGNVTIDNVDRDWTFGSSNSFNLGGNFLVTNQDGTRTNAFNTSISLNAGIREFQINQAGGTNTVNFQGASVISGSGGINKTGAGTMVLAGGNANTYTGLTTVTAGQLTLNKTAGVNAIAGDIRLAGGTLVWSASNQIADTSTMTVAASTTIGTGQLPAPRQETIGTLAFDLTSASTGLTIGSGVNGFTATAVNTSGFTPTSGAAAIVLGGGSTLVVTQLTVGSDGLTMGGESILLNGSAAVGALGNRLVLGGNVTASGTNTISRDNVAQAFGGVNELDLGAAVRTFNITSGTTSIANNGVGLISIVGAGGGINKTGTGTLVIQASATYTGATTVSAGTMNIATGGNINSTSGITVLNGATLANNSGSAITPALTLSEGAILAGANAFAPSSLTITADLTDGTFTSISAGAANLTKSGNLTFSFTNVTPGAAFSLFTGTPTGAFSGVSVASTALSTADAGATFFGTVGGFDYTFTNSNNTLLVVSAIPEPSTFAAVCGLGVLMVAATRRRRA